MQANQNLPFSFREVKDLKSLGLNADLFKFGNLTFESQKYICVKDGNVSNNIFGLFFLLTLPLNLKSNTSYSISKLPSSTPPKTSSSTEET